jgi:catechol 2,3-dioxygenase-like lactoylglutathione lyase family enzyme
LARIHARALAHVSVQHTRCAPASSPVSARSSFSSATVRAGSSAIGTEPYRHRLEWRPHGTRLETAETLAKRSPAKEEGPREAEGPAGEQEVGGPVHAARLRTGSDSIGYVTAIHLYVTDLDYAIDFYSRLLGYGPQAAYDEGENAHSAFFVLEQRTHLVLTWDPDRGRETGGSVRLELAAENLDEEIETLRSRGIARGHITRTRFGTDVYDLEDPDGHLIRLGPAWTLHAIEGAV